MSLIDNKTISANARIDYILRFSKHAVLVIDDNPEVFSNVGNQFLGALSGNYNAAFVSISSKLNDIQVRCRIIEQLFGNSLFDPEQPLSVNVIKLSEAKNEAITIVIGNAEHLSMQLSHELCQLAEVAKKLNKTIDVVLLGTVQAAINLSTNKHLFDKKISILLAENGQVIGFNSALLQQPSSRLLGSFSQKSLIIFICMLCIIGLVAALLWEYQSKKPSSELANNTENTEEYKKDFIKLPPNEPAIEESLEQVEELNLANTQEIFQSLTLNQNKHANEVMPKSNETALLDIIPVEKKVIDKVLEPSINKDTFGDENYYQKITQGYVVQVAGFEKLAGLKAFLSNHQDNQFYSYTRLVNNKKSYIVTTQVYKTDTEAKIAINSLSEELRKKGPWIKSLQSVNNEINLFQQPR